MSNRVQYRTCDGERVLVFPFHVEEEGHLVVARGEDILTPRADYAIFGLGDPKGGYIRLTNPPQAGQVFTLIGRLPLVRQADFAVTRSLTPRFLNAELDRVYQAIQQVADVAASAVRKSPYSANEASPILPEPEAGRALAWDETAKALVNTSMDLEAIGREMRSLADQVARDSREAAASADRAKASAGDARATEDGFQSTIDNATQAVISAADKAAMAAEKAASLVKDACNPRRAFMRLRLLDL